MERNESKQASVGAVLVHHSLHSLPLVLHVGHQLKLGAAAVQVLALTVGAEVVVALQIVGEEMDFEPFFTELERRLSGRPVALFGSYGWGDGQWMRDWVQRTQDANANLYQDQGLMINETPDEDGLEQCREFGRGFAKY